MSSIKSCDTILQSLINGSNYLLNHLKVLYVGLTRLNLAVQNIGVGFFSPGPSYSDLKHMQVARLTTPTGTSAHDDE